MSINSPTGILDVTNATIRAGKLESTGDITCSSNLDATGQQTDEANCVHRAAFVGCTYHCG